MTDNRMNEPTEAQARAVRKLDNVQAILAGAQASVTDAMRELSLTSAALVAAHGAAPQVGVLPETGNELRDEDGDLISSGKHLRILQQGMYVCDTCTNVLGLNVRWDHAIKRDDHAPVLPSSGVDEVRAEAVREVARYINRIAPNGLVPKKMILADMEFAADRLGRGIHANGNDRAVQGGESRDE